MGSYTDGSWQQKRTLNSLPPPDSPSLRMHSKSPINKQQKSTAYHHQELSSELSSNTLENQAVGQLKRLKKMVKGKKKDKNEPIVSKSLINYQKWEMPQVLTELGMILQWEIDLLPKRQGQG
jgi:hypothetical protein